MRFNIYGVSYLQYSHPVVVNCAFLNYYGRFSLLHRACCFDYFFNIPTHVPIIYTLKSTNSY
jgi:hypothetical protein